LPWYALSGLFLHSERPLATLPGSSEPSSTQGTIHFETTSQRFPTPEDWLVVRTFPQEERAWLSAARVAGGYLLRVHDLADFVVDAGGTKVLCAPEPGCDEATLEQLLVDQILPQVLHLRGRFSLHASSVAWTSDAVVGFAGLSGAGKSTLAASLAQGRSLVSDDCLAITLSSAGVLVHPSYPSARLCRDSAQALFGNRAALELASPRTSKLRVALPVSSGPLVLRRLYILEEHFHDIFCPDVPEASSGRRGLLSHTSTPWIM